MRYTIYTLFIVYLSTLAYLIIFKYPSGMMFNISDANFIPLKTILIYLNGEPTWNIAFRNIFGNIVLFMPLGVFISLLYKFKLKGVIIVALFVSLIIESTQALFNIGIFDIDDILLNILGTLSGYLIFISIKNIYDKFKI